MSKLSLYHSFLPSIPLISREINRVTTRGIPYQTQDTHQMVSMAFVHDERPICLCIWETVLEACFGDIDTVEKQ